MHSDTQPKPDLCSTLHTCSEQPTCAPSLAVVKLTSHKSPFFTYASPTALTDGQSWVQGCLSVLILTQNMRERGTGCPSQEQRAKKWCRGWPLMRNETLAGHGLFIHEDNEQFSPSRQQRLLSLYHIVFGEQPSCDNLKSNKGTQVIKEP